MTRHAITAVIIVAVTACGGGDDVPATESTPATEPTTRVAGETATDRFPTVENVAPEQNADGTWNFSVTMTSPYDSPERYADGWRVIGPDGTEFGVHTLTHDHAAEQPFTRRQSNVTIPDDVDEVTIEGRDLVNGFGGESFTVGLDRG